MRWYWCKECGKGREESVGFTSRAQCEADAFERGLRPEDRADERRISLSRLLGGADLRGLPRTEHESHG
jgi:hypothetical protein